MRPPIAKPVEVLSGSLEILNIRCDELLMAPFESWDRVTSLLPNAQPGQPTIGKKIITFTQHCELTLALKMLKLGAGPKFTQSIIEIGVSKACCEWEYTSSLCLRGSNRHFVMVPFVMYARIKLRSPFKDCPDGGARKEWARTYSESKTSWHCLLTR